MKRLFVFITLILLMTGCTPERLQKDADVQADTQEIVQPIVPIDTTDNISLPVGQELSIIEDIFTSLEKGGVISPYAVDSKEVELPSYIDSSQIVKGYKLGNDILFALYQKNSLNTPIQSDSSQAGILVRRASDSIWESFLALQDTQVDAKNNPYYFWVKDTVMNVLIVDVQGAGSGEGIAKVFQLNKDLSTWDMNNCFYYMPELSELINVEQDNISASINKYLVNNPTFNKVDESVCATVRLDSIKD